jgi:ACS family pantothenate transporter-like MFS transporter
VTPGNRAAAVIAGFNVIVFTTIYLLSRREQLQKKRSGGIDTASTSSEPSTPTPEEHNEKKIASGVKAVEV